MAKRRRNSEGSITQRADSRWEARLSLPDGSRKSLYGKTEKEVLQKLKVAQRDADSGLPVISHTQTLGNYLEDWLVMVKPQRRLGTWFNYRGYVTNHIQRIESRKCGKLLKVADSVTN